MPEIMVTAKNMSLKNGNIVFGGTMVVSGILGTVIGAYLADKYKKVTPRAPIIICAVSILLATPFAAAVLFIDNHVAFFTVLFICEVFLFINTAPITIVLLESVPNDQRSIAMGLSVLAIHVLGDAISPALIGWYADKTDIITANVLLPIVLVIGFLFWYLSFRSQKVEPETSA